MQNSLKHPLFWPTYLNKYFHLEYAKYIYGKLREQATYYIMHKETIWLDSKKWLNHVPTKLGEDVSL